MCELVMLRVFVWKIYGMCICVKDLCNVYACEISTLCALTWKIYAMCIRVDCLRYVRLRGRSMQCVFVWTVYVINYVLRTELLLAPTDPET